MRKLFIESVFLLICFCWIQNLDAQERKASQHRVKGTTSINDLGIHAGLGSYTIAGVHYQNSETVVSFQSILSYMITPHFATGAGLGFESWKTINFLPVFIDLRYYILADQPMNPFVYLDGGFARKWGTSPRNSVIKYAAGSSGDLFVNGGIGMKAFISKTTALNLSLGYKIQQMNLSYMTQVSPLGGSADLISQAINFQFLTIKAGLSF